EPSATSGSRGSDMGDSSSPAMFPPFEFSPNLKGIELRPPGYFQIDQTGPGDNPTENVLVRLLNQAAETWPAPTAEEGSTFRARSNTINQKLMDDLNEIARRFLTRSWNPPECLERYQLALAENKRQLAELE